VTRFFDESAFERCHMSGKNPFILIRKDPIGLGFRKFSPKINSLENSNDP
jgi:hypothetical protein